MHPPLATRLASALGSVDELLSLTVPPLAAIGQVVCGAEAHATPLPLRASEWGAVQITLLTNTLVTWASALDRDLLDSILRGWFTPSGSGAFVWRDTLSTLSLLLVTPQHAQTKILMRQVLQNLAPDQAVTNLLSSANENATRREMEWRTSVAQLIALPVRVANVWEMDAAQILDQECVSANSIFLSGVSCAVDSNIEAHSGGLAVLVSRLASSGYVARDTRGPSFWETLVPCMLKPERQSARYASAWQNLWQNLPQSAQEVVAYSLCTFLDQRLQSTGCAWPVASAEQAPASEGRAFLSARATEATRAVCALLDLVIGDVSGATKADLVRLSPVHVPPWTPLMGACLVHWIVSPSDAPEVIPIFVNIWGDQTRCRRASRKEEQLLTVMLASCVHSDRQVLERVSLSSAFLGGVSAHLENADGGVRRLGMLVAELFSAASGRALTFPSSVWDGRGDLREVARVIRAYAMAESPPAAAAVASADILCVKSAQPQPKTTLTQAPRRQAPPTRTLPTRIPKSTPAESNLIQVIEPDEEPDGFKTYAHESESESESESDSDGDDPEARNVAMDLAGMDDNALRQVPETDTLDKAFNKKQRPPVYIGELVPLLREQDYKANRMALKHAEPLIRRKTRWGSELRMLTQLTSRKCDRCVCRAMRPAEHIRNVVV